MEFFLMFKCISGPFRELRMLLAAHFPGRDKSLIYSSRLYQRLLVATKHSVLLLCVGPFSFTTISGTTC